MNRVFRRLRWAIATRSGNIYRPAATWAGQKRRVNGPCSAALSPPTTTGVVAAMPSFSHHQLSYQIVWRRPTAGSGTQAAAPRKLASRRVQTIRREQWQALAHPLSSARYSSAPPNDTFEVTFQPSAHCSGLVMEQLNVGVGRQSGHAGIRKPLNLSMPARQHKPASH